MTLPLIFHSFSFFEIISLVPGSTRALECVCVCLGVCVCVCVCVGGGVKDGVGDKLFAQMPCLWTTIFISSSDHESSYKHDNMDDVHRVVLPRLRLRRFRPIAGPMST